MRKLLLALVGSVLGLVSTVNAQVAPPGGGTPPLAPDNVAITINPNSFVANPNIPPGLYLKVDVTATNTTDPTTGFPVIGKVYFNPLGDSPDAGHILAKQFNVPIGTQSQNECCEAWLNIQLTQAQLNQGFAVLAVLYKANGEVVTLDYREFGVSAAPPQALPSVKILPDFVRFYQDGSDPTKQGVEFFVMVYNPSIAQGKVHAQVQYFTQSSPNGALPINQYQDVPASPNSCTKRFIFVGDYNVQKAVITVILEDGYGTAVVSDTYTKFASGGSNPPPTP